MALRDLKIGDWLTPEEEAEFDASFDALTPEQQWACFLSQVRSYSRDHGLTVEDTRRLFYAGMAAKQMLIGPSATPASLRR